MIIELFILFTVLGIILAITGRVVNYELLMIFGFLIFMFMAIPLLNNNLEYRTGYNLTTISDNSTLFCHYVQDGETTYYKYGNNYTGYHWDYSSPSPSINDVNLFHTYNSYNYTEICEPSIKEVNTYNYESYNGTVWYGIFFLLISLGSLFEYWYTGYGRGKREE